MKVDKERRIVKLGPSVGQHHGRDIPSFYITGDGVRHEYVRPSLTDADGGTPLSQLAADESVIAPGLIYRAVTVDGEQG